MSRRFAGLVALEVALSAGCAGSAKDTPVECNTDAQCTTPGRCEVAPGARCTDRRCVYQARACTQAAPVNPCRALGGTCDPTLDGGACEGDACCAFAPAWPAGSADPAPACPWFGEDEDWDGVRDAGETWSGTCDHAGACDECTAAQDCLASSPCAVPSCVDGTCREDTTSRAGEACVHPNGADAGVCTPAAGGGIACLLKKAEPCTAGAQCASGSCVDGVCCDRACPGGCARCNVAGAVGTCMPDAARCGGDCAECNLKAGAYVCEGNVALCRGSCAACLGAGNVFDCGPSESACTGDCDVCTLAGGAYGCTPEPALCAGNCDACTGSGTAFSCTAVPATCSGDCATCAPLQAGTGFSCAANAAACAGDCATCAGGGTAFSCGPDESVCAGPCSTCTMSAGAFGCQLSDAGTTCGSQSCSGLDTYYASTASVNGDDFCYHRTYAPVTLTCNAGGGCAASGSCGVFTDTATATCGSCTYAALGPNAASCACADYPTTQACTRNGVSAANYTCSGGTCTCTAANWSVAPDGKDNDCDGAVDEVEYRVSFYQGGMSMSDPYTHQLVPMYSCNDVCALQSGACVSVGTDPGTPAGAYQDGATDGLYWGWAASTDTCWPTAGATCGTTLTFRSAATACESWKPEWTYCRCRFYM